MGTYGGPDKNHAVHPDHDLPGADRTRSIWPTSSCGPPSPKMMKPALGELHQVFAAKYGFDPEDDARDPDLGHRRRRRRSCGNILLGIQMFLGIIGGLTLMIGGVGRRQHHVRRREGANPRDRREDGARRAAGVDHAARSSSRGSRTRSSGGSWACCSRWLIIIGLASSHRRERGASNSSASRRSPPPSAIAGRRARHDRAAGGVLPRAPRRIDRPGANAALRVRSHDA